MPVTHKQDSAGPYYQFGESGYKYRYTKGNEESKKRAEAKAMAQEKAAHAGGYNGE